MTRMTFAIAACLILTAASAQAATQTTLVRSADLNLSKPADAQKMLTRLERASLEVCGGGFGAARMVVDDVKGSECYLKALSSAVQAAKAPQLEQALATAYPSQGHGRMAVAGR